MKIVIDGRLWAESGIGRYLRNLIHELQNLDQTNEYYILHLQKEYDSLVYHTNFHKVLADFRWYTLAEQIKLPRLIDKLQPDLVHFPHFNVPIFYRGKFIVTIHDLIHQHHQTREVTTKNPLVFQMKKFGYKKAFDFAAKKSVKIITPSDFVKKQLNKEWQISTDKIQVTHEAVDQSIINLAKQITASDFSKISIKFGIQRPYLFYVGNAQPHKNITGLIEAFNQIKQQFPGYQLVLSGPDHYFWKQIKDVKNDRDIIFTGFVTERELVTLYKNAAAFVMPSQEEGFGIPILEAMACGCPVISSNAASLPEVGGDAAVYFDPLDIKDMIEKILMVLNDRKLQKELIKKGLQRYKEFSWKKLAEQTLKEYKIFYDESKKNSGNT